jgi:hypothetical protein
MFSKEQVLIILARTNQIMKKALLFSSLLIFLAVGMNSCKKCYVCTITTTEIINDKDSTVTLSTEQCSGKNGAGSSANLNSAIQDIEANGYICTPK